MEQAKPFMEAAIDWALQHDPAMIKADLLKLLRRQAELEAEVDAYRRRFGPVPGDGRREASPTKTNGASAPPEAESGDYGKNGRYRTGSAGGVLPLV